MEDLLLSLIFGLNSIRPFFFTRLDFGVSSYLCRPFSRNSVKIENENSSS